jgi:hypothetical protein
MKLKEKGEIKWLLYPLHRRMYMYYTKAKPL